VNAPLPVIDRGILTKLLQTVLPAEEGATPSLVLVGGRYHEGEGSFRLQRGDGTTGRSVQVVVTDQASVLGVVDAWQKHRSADHGNQVLVITTGAPEEALGWELRGHALKGRVLPVDRSELVRARFQAPSLDPRIASSAWLVDALLAAEPAAGWPPAGGVLTLDTAMQALVSARLCLDVDPRDGLDLTQLLAWSRRPGAGEVYAGLDDAERTGIAGWLGGRTGAGTTLLLALAAAGRARDAMALGVLCSLADQPDVSAGAAMALGGLLGGIEHRPAELRGLADAVTGTLTRWIAEAAVRGGRDSEPGTRVLDVVRRADHLAAGAGLTPSLVTNSLLPSALDSQLRELASAVNAPANPASPGPDDVARVEAALDVVARHGLVQLDARRLDVARMAVRLQRWLATPADEVASVAAGVALQLARWGWVDRALDMVWAGDPGGDGVLENAYRRVHDAARARRDRLDEEFAARLQPWAAHACTQEPAGCLLIEDVLRVVVAPLAARGAARGAAAPLVLVLDGMSSAVAVELAEQLRERGWVEASTSRAAGARRVAAVSTLPTVTRWARASLLTGRVTAGDQAAETEGFAAFWRHHGREGVVFHKAELVGRTGQRLSDPVMQALSGAAVVGVVLNTVDDALDHGQEGDRTGWSLGRITYLDDLLDAARAYGRPVVLTCDHGHVLDRSLPGQGPTAADGVQSARWRTGTAGDGEIEVTGPRVRTGDGTVVLPWRETIRYTPRKAGYHGGASLAEVTVPVVTMFPDPDLIPGGWTELTAGDVVPPWWTGQAVTPSPVDLVPPARVEPRQRKAPPVQSESLFDDVEAAEPTSVGGLEVPAVAAGPVGQSVGQPVGQPVGQRVVASDVYGLQKAFVRKAPEKNQVADVIDALIAASGTLPIGAVATRLSRAGRRSEQVVTTLERLLNVEGYPVVSRIDAGRTVRLDVALLREQFGLDTGA
jgi:hypothetical protein